MRGYPLDIMIKTKMGASLLVNWVWCVQIAGMVDR